METWYDGELIEPRFVPREAFRRMVTRPESEAASGVSHLNYAGDAITAMASWAFRPPPSPLRHVRQSTVTNRQGEYRNDPVKRELAKVGRNDPCPCGSGKKFKKCCGAG